MRRTLIIILAFTLLSSQAFGAGPSTDKTKSTAAGTSRAKEKSKSKTISDTDSNGKSGQTSHTVDTGTSEATRKELRKATDKMRDKGLSRTMPLVPIFVSSLAPQYPWLDNLTIDDLLIVSTSDGRKLTMVQNLSTRAQAQGSAEGIVNKEQILKVMDILQRLGIWIAEVSGKVSPDDIMGAKDWREIVTAIAASPVRLAEIEKIELVHNTAGPLHFLGSYTRIQAGACVLDMTRTRGIPELTCSGLSVFSADSANGQSMSVSANTKVSWSDTESLSVSDEKFKRVTDSLNTYTKWAVDHSDARAVAAVRRNVIDITARNDSKVSAVVAALDHKEDPNGILGMMGVK